MHPTTVVNRVGGGATDNLELKPRELKLSPPGISVLITVTPYDAAEQMRQAFPDPIKYDRIHALARVVGSTTVELIRSAGFEIIPDPSERFANHARIIHPDGAQGFSEENLRVLAAVFSNMATERSTR